jgi:hypothetical protein
MLRRFLKWALPERTYGKLEAESRSWFMVCDVCGYAVSYWDAGGIRAGATSRKKRVLGRCPRCHKFRFFRVIKKDPERAVSEGPS